MLSYQNQKLATADALLTYNMPDAIDNTNPNSIYVGHIKAGKWHITQINNNNSVYTFLYPNGDDSFSYVWANRATYGYSQRSN